MASKDWEMTKQTKMALAMIGVFAVAMGVQGGAGYAALNGIDGMRKIPQMSLRQMIPVNHTCVHYCELKAKEICDQNNKDGVKLKVCFDKQLELCFTRLKYGDC